MNTLPDEIITKVAITWTRPIDYDRLIETSHPKDDEAHLYMITARFSTKTSKIVYIGKTYKQNVSTRLKQPDHKKRRKLLHRKYKKHKLRVSLGLVSISGGNCTRRRIDEVESLLIYAGYQPTSINLRKIWDHRVADSYEIRNFGYRNGLPSRICFGLFIN